MSANQREATASPPSRILVALLSRSAAGDREAFAELYHLTSPRLFALALRLMRRRDLAEDLLQEVFLRVWRKAGLYRADAGEPWGWLVVMLRHCAFDRLRQNRPLLAAAGSDGGAGAAVAVSEDWQQAGISEDLRDCIAQLDSNQRRAILLAYYYGLTHEELSSHLQVPLGTAKSWIRRGVVRLKECLTDAAG